MGMFLLLAPWHSADHRGVALKLECKVKSGNSLIEPRPLAGSLAAVFRPEITSVVLFDTKAVSHYSTSTRRTAA